MNEEGIGGLAGESLGIGIPEGARNGFSSQVLVQM
jgi:hypothetical protein